MARFIEMTDRDGKAVLVNIDRVTAVTFDNENNSISKHLFSKLLFSKFYYICSK